MDYGRGLIKGASGIIWERKGRKVGKGGRGLEAYSLKIREPFLIWIKVRIFLWSLIKGVEGSRRRVGGYLPIWLMGVGLLRS